jgi:hypothetical protein
MHVGLTPDIIGRVTRILHVQTLSNQLRGPSAVPCRIEKVLQLLQKNKQLQIENIRQSSRAAKMANFTVPISTGGSFTCSTVPGENNEDIYVLSFNLAPDNRVTLPFIDAFILSLKILEYNSGGKGVLIITSGISKFFSNGYDLEHTRSHDDFFERCVEFLREIMVYVLLNRGCTYNCLQSN